MALDQPDCRVDERDLHDRLSADRLEDLVQRGLVTPPEQARGPRRAQVTAREPVSGLVSEQRR